MNDLISELSRIFSHFEGDTLNLNFPLAPRLVDILDSEFTALGTHHNYYAHCSKMDISAMAPDCYGKSWISNAHQSNYGQTWIQVMP